MKSKISTSSSSVPKKGNMFSDKKNKKNKRRNVFDLTGVDGEDSHS